MRVIAGTLGGRIFQSPHGYRTHPMSDKMRGALFNSLGDITGLTVLDAFAGSGALCFEALSRGAASALAVERDRNAQRAIAENMRTLGVNSSMKLIKAGAGAWLRTTNDTFDIVLLDPPYNALQYDLLDELVTRVAANGTLVLSWPGKEMPPKFAGFSVRTQKQYGDGSLHIYDRA